MTCWACLLRQAGWIDGEVDETNRWSGCGIPLSRLRGDSHYDRLMEVLRRNLCVMWDPEYEEAEVSV